MTATPSKTVLVTGASGYIGKHIVRALLDAGYAVRGSTRSDAKADEVRQAVRAHVKDPASLARLTFVALDLTSDTGWPEALDGIDVLMHTASPFPMAQPKDEDDVIRPAVDGARRALVAARDAGVHRVILTSSVAAVMCTDLPRGKPAFDEDDWSDPAHPTNTPYTKSKTLAERAAWDFAADHPQITLTTINPGLVLGPPLDDSYGTSIAVVERLVRGKDPMLPRIGFPVVDVRDVAEMHVRAIDTEATYGKRLLAADSFLWFSEVGETIKAAHPGRKVPTREAPNLVVRALALFDPTIRAVLPSLGVRTEVSNARARETLGLQFTPARTSVTETADWLVARL